MDIKDLIVKYSYLVIRNQVLSFLDVNDLLRLRSVSKAFKISVEDYIRTQKVKTNSEIRVDFRESDPIKVRNKSRNYVRDLREMNELLKRSDLPIKTGVIIQFPKKSDVLSISTRFHYFLDNFTCGSSINTLDILQLQLPLSCARMDKFFDLFPNLATLRIESVVASSEDTIASTSSVDVEEIMLPSSLTKLKTLRIMNFRCDESQTMAATQNAFDFMATIVETSISTLESLDLPFYEFKLRGVPTRKVVSLVCKCLATAPLLKLEMVHGGIIELLLKPENLVQEMPSSMATIMSSINDKIASIWMPWWNSYLLELPNLEIIAFSTCRMPPLDEFVRQEWPKLKEISLCLDDSQYDEDTVNVGVVRMWKFLFGGGIQRKNVADLTITFGGFKRDNIQQRNHSLPRTMQLMTSCPNLKILRLQGKIKELVNIQKLWNGLPLLEKMSFYDCADLDDFDFIGDDPQNPEIWKLKRLKVLQIENLGVTKVTDDLLSKVLCRMPLKYLSLDCESSSSCQHSITTFGIRSLLNGQFASTIERLDISRLNLGNSAWDNGNAKLASLFRSSKMM